jgi:hypothetical protein
MQSSSHAPHSFPLSQWGICSGLCIVERFREDAAGRALPEAPSGTGVCQERRQRSIGIGESPQRVGHPH